MRPFKIDIPQFQLDDLNQRLVATRWPDEMPGAGWSRGVPLTYIKELAEYWRTAYDWRGAERYLNTFPQFVTDIDGVQVHFLHVRSSHADAMPLILTHGWPSSIVEFIDVIDPLVNPTAHGGSAADAFHVVIPSVPGFTFSGPTRQPGWDTERIAGAWKELMRSLGYDRYLAQGGDWGAPISLRLGLADPDHVAGVHLNFLVVFPPADPADPAAMDALMAELSPEDTERVQRGGYFEQDGIGWLRIQATRPQTLAYSLTDSPTGQLAWIVEKFKEWSDSTDRPEDAVSRGHLLTNVMLYWLTATAGSSAQIYYESLRLNTDFARTWGGPWPLTMPVAVGVSPKDLGRPVRRWAEMVLPTLTQWTEHSRGGHFAALEQPDVFVTDVRKFARSVR
jgi:epoxide hydrolase